MAWSRHGRRGRGLDKNRDAVVRFAMAYLQGIKEFTALKPELVKAIAPHWSYIADDGLPLVDSIMEMQDFWSGKYFSFVEKKVSRAQLFDLNVAKEAQARLEREKPFN
jgi:NitT/TauT family transport system substrate-binding protein